VLRPGRAVLSYWLVLIRRTDTNLSAYVVNIGTIELLYTAGCLGHRVRLGLIGSGCIGIRSAVLDSLGVLSRVSGIVGALGGCVLE